MRLKPAKFLAKTSSSNKQTNKQAPPCAIRQRIPFVTDRSAPAVPNMTYRRRPSPLPIHPKPSPFRPWTRSTAAEIARNAHPALNHPSSITRTRAPPKMRRRTRTRPNANLAGAILVIGECECLLQLFCGERSPDADWRWRR